MREGSYLKFLVFLYIGMCTVAATAGEISPGKQDPHETMKGPYVNGTAVTGEIHPFMMNHAGSWA